MKKELDKKQIIVDEEIFKNMNYEIRILTKEKQNLKMEISGSRTTIYILILLLIIGLYSYFRLNSNYQFIYNKYTSDCLSKNKI